MPWTLKQQIYNRKIEVPTKKKTKKDQEKWLNLGNLQYFQNAKKIKFFVENKN
jgi:hypothetical protein